MSDGAGGAGGAGSVEPEGPTDAALLAAHVAGDAEAFGLLIRRHRDRLWAVALRTCGDPDMAADGLQDAVVAAFRRAGSFRGDAAVTTWLHRVVVNACLDRLRAAKVRRAEPLPDAGDDVDRLLLDAAPVGSAGSGGSGGGAPVDPADEVVRRERRERVLAALARLSDEQRAAVVLVDMEGYSVAETAVILECAEGTVKSRCSRARARLAVLLADVLEPAGEPTGVSLSATPASAVAGGDGNPARDPHVGPVARRGPPAGAAEPPDDPSPPVSQDHP